MSDSALRPADLGRAAGPSVGAARAMAMEVLHEWRLARLAPDFRAWLEAGAPAADADDVTGDAASPTRTASRERE